MRPLIVCLTVRCARRIVRSAIRLCSLSSLLVTFRSVREVTPEMYAVVRPSGKPREWRVVLTTLRHVKPFSSSLLEHVIER